MASFVRCDRRRIIGSGKDEGREKWNFRFWDLYPGANGVWKLREAGVRDTGHKGDVRQDGTASWNGRDPGPGEAYMS
jgi:hypothetical protein